MRTDGGPDRSGPGLYWNGSRSRPGLVHGFLYNLCSAVTSCFYVFCCCWLIEDCFMGRRSFPGPPFGSLEPPHLPPPPPQPAVVGPRSHGLLGSIIGGPPGPPGPPGQPSPFGYPGAPAPYG